MTVKCKHGTEVYKFRCPECEDERRVAAHKSLEASEGRLSKMVDNFDNAYGRTHDESELLATDAVYNMTETDLERLSAILHDIYQDEAKRQNRNLGRPIKHADAYEELQESTKEYDRVLARYIIERESRILNRLAAAERRCKELEAEKEWRGLLIAVMRHGCDLIREDRESWLLELSDGSDIIIGADRYGLPARPSDDVVAKIKEAING